MTINEYYHRERRQIAAEILQLLDVQILTGNTGCRTAPMLAERAAREGALRDWANAVLDPEDRVATFRATPGGAA